MIYANIKCNSSMERIFDANQGTLPSIKLRRKIQKMMTAFVDQLKDYGVAILPQCVKEDPHELMKLYDDAASYEWENNEIYIESKIISGKLGLAIRYSCEDLLHKVSEKFPNKKFCAVFSVDITDSCPGIVVHFYQYREKETIIDADIEKYEQEAILFAVFYRT